MLIQYFILSRIHQDMCGALSLSIMYIWPCLCCRLKGFLVLGEHGAPWHIWLINLLGLGHGKNDHGYQRGIIPRDPGNIGKQSI